MKTLVIYNGKDNISDDSTYFYSLGIGQVNDSISLNNTNKLNKIALKIRDSYSDFIYSINKNYLENDLIYKKDFSLYFISDLSNKRTEFFNTYISICHILAIQDMIKDNNICKVKFINCEENFINSFSSLIKITAIEENTIKSPKFKFYFLKQFRFFFRSFFSIVYFKIFYKNRVFDTIHKLFLSRFPLHFDKDFKEEKYASMVKENDVYLISILTDGMHQGLSFINTIKQIKKLMSYKQTNNYILLDIEVPLFSVIKNYFYSIKLYFDFKELEKNNYEFNNINISSFIKEEIKKSFLRIPRLTMYDEAVKKIFIKNKIQKFYYYLHEYSYGKYLTYLLNKYSNKTKKIGFQHGPASMRKLLYFLSDKEVNYNSNDYLNYLPMPDEVLAEDNQSKLVYEKANYQNVKIMNKIYRLSYLENIKRDKIEKNTVLIACGLHDAEFIFNYMKEEIKYNKNIKYYFKLHPRSNKEKVIEIIENNNFENVFIAEEHISTYLSFVEEVIFTYSSVGMEAFKLGIKVRTISLPNKINESPLLDFEDKHE